MQYANLFGQLVSEVFPEFVEYDGIKYGIEERFTPEFIADLVICDDEVRAGWTYVDGGFSPPVPWTPPVPTLGQKQAEKDARLKDASIAMTPAFLAIQLGDATDSETLAAKAWRTYYIALQAVDIAVEDPAWPIPPELSEEV